MKPINLLPVRMRQRDATSRLLTPLLTAIVIGGVAVAGMTYFLKNEVSAAQEQLTTYQQAQATQAKKGATPATDAAGVADLVNRVTQINTYSKDEVNWNRAITGVGLLIPRDTSLSNFSFASGTDGNLALKITGISPTNLSFATFFASLTGDPFLTQVVVDGYTLDPVKGTVNFSLHGTVRLAQVNFPPSK